jgi:hypothetical protein
MLCPHGPVMRTVWTHDERDLIDPTDGTGTSLPYPVGYVILWFSACCMTKGDLQASTQMLL